MGMENMFEKHRETERERERERGREREREGARERERERERETERKQTQKTIYLIFISSELLSSIKIGGRSHLATLCMRIMVVIGTAWMKYHWPEWHNQVSSRRRSRAAGADITAGCQRGQMRILPIWLQHVSGMASKNNPKVGVLPSRNYKDSVFKFTVKLRAPPPLCLFLTPPAQPDVSK